MKSQQVIQTENIEYLYLQRTFLYLEKQLPKRLHTAKKEERLSASLQMVINWSYLSEVVRMD